MHRAQIGCFQNRIGEISQNSFNLRIADEALGLGRKRYSAEHRNRRDNVSGEAFNLHKSLHFARPLRNLITLEGRMREGGCSASPLSELNLR